MTFAEFAATKNLIPGSAAWNLAQDAWNAALASSSNGILGPVWQSYKDSPGCGLALAAANKHNLSLLHYTP
jgi:hypothetical protein